MIKEVSLDEIQEAGKKGPQIGKTKAAQLAVDEFLASGLDACQVDWRRIDSDFDQAKRSVAYRISHTKYDRNDDVVSDLAMRSNREKGEIYLVHSNKAGE